MKLPKSLEILENITNDDNITSICRKTKIEPPNMSKHLAYLESIKAIVTERFTRERRIFLTDKGIKIINSFHQLKQSINSNEDLTLQPREPLDATIQKILQNEIELDDVFKEKKIKVF